MYDQTGRLLRLYGPFKAGTYVISGMHGQEHVSQCYVFEITLVSTQLIKDTNALLGKPATLCVGNASMESRTINIAGENFGPRMA